MIDAAKRARPDLPLPTCRVILVCGPPAVGKTTYVKKNSKPGDIIVDLDMIALEIGLNHEKNGAHIATLLEIRNQRLVLLSLEPPERIAWVIVSAPSALLREWWATTLRVQPDDLVLLKAQRGELYSRILNDPKRKPYWKEQLALVDKWFDRERENDPGILSSGCDKDGRPLDPLHPWNQVFA